MLSIALAKAARIRPGPDLRDEAIACLALTDLRPVASRFDFRDAEWSSQTVRTTDGQVTTTVDRPRGGHLALFGEFEYKIGELPYSFTTQVFQPSLIFR